MTKINQEITDLCLLELRKKQQKKIGIAEDFFLIKKSKNLISKWFNKIENYNSSRESVIKQFGHGIEREQITQELFNFWYIYHALSNRLSIAMTFPELEHLYHHDDKLVPTTEELKEKWRHIYKNDMDSPQTARKYFKFLCNNHYFSEAHNLVDILLKQFPSKISIQCLPAELLMAEGFVGKAIDFLDKKNIEFPSKIKLKVTMAEAYRRAGLVDEYDQVIEQISKKISLSDRMLRLSLGLNQDIDAGYRLLSFLKNNKNIIQATPLAVKFLNSSGERSLSVKILNACLKCPHIIDEHSSIFEALLQQGDKELESKAQKLFSHIIRTCSVEKFETTRNLLNPVVA
ncbi:MAG: hypothetical protein K9L30_17065 [Desulfobacterales bacterium]|nr:hypothetical protein [Desulfobacterales bacterium]